MELAGCSWKCEIEFDNDIPGDIVRFSHLHRTWMYQSSWENDDVTSKHSERRRLEVVDWRGLMQEVHFEIVRNAVDNDGAKLLLCNFFRKSAQGHPSTINRVRRLVDAGVVHVEA